MLLKKTLFILALLSALCTKAQNIDSLKLAAQNAPMDTSKISMYALLTNLCEVKDIALYAKLAIAYADEITKIPGHSEAFTKKLLHDKASALSNLGYFYDSYGNTLEALDAYQESIVMLEKAGDEKEVSYILSNMALVYNAQQNYDKSEEYYNKALQLNLKLGDKAGVASTLYNLGNMYFSQKKFKLAEPYFHRSLLYAREAKYDAILGQCLTILSTTMLQKNKMDSAQIYAQEALQIGRQTKTLLAKINGYVCIAQLCKVQKKYDKALYFLDSAYVLGKDENLGTQSRTEREYYYIYKEKNDHKNALEHYIKMKLLDDSMSNDRSRQASLKNQLKFDFELKEAALQEQQERERLVAKNTEHVQQLIIAGVVAGLVLVIIFAFSIFRSLQKNREANKIITAQKEEMQEKNFIIEEKQKEIIDSINYAKRIQYTLLAHEEFLHAHLHEHFVYFDPKDIVSGDFYWAVQHDDKFYLAVCDSTGHGVPGAFMSLLNIGFLSEAINEKNILEPHKVFEHVRERLIANVSKEGQRDGFDGILMCFERSKNKITYAAANNTPLVVKNGTLIELPSDRMPVGIGEKKDKFKLYTIDLEKGDLLYLFTDGYADQFGGPKGKKFMSKRLNEKLLSISSSSLNDQHSQLKKSFEEWKGDLEQVDDVCVIGIML